MTKRKTRAAGWSFECARESVSAGHLRQFAAFLNRLSLVAGLMMFCGCQTAPRDLFTATGAGWHVQQGQALWRPKRGLPEFGGDLVMATDANGRCLIQFDKTPMSILSAQTTSSSWLIRFPQRQMGFSGHGHGSTRFAWLYLHAALAGETLPAALHFERKADGGWRLENTRTGETIEGFLSP
jgi:hypothetical protein